MSNYTTLIERLRTQVANQPVSKQAFTFLADSETKLDSLTYQQLDKRVRAIAASLQANGAEGERALLLYQPGLEFITAFLGCLYAGVVAVPAYPPRANHSMLRLLSIALDARAKFALTTQDWRDAIENKFIQEAPQQRLHFIATDTIRRDRADDWYYPAIRQNSLAFLQYTSGSTGKPKGVMVAHSNIMANSQAINYCFQNHAEQSGVSWLPPYHDMGLIGGIIQPLYAGMSMYLMAPVTFLQRPHRWLKTISRYRASFSGGPNFAYDLCVDRLKPEQLCDLDLSCWELAFTGAEPVRAATIERFSNYFRGCGFQKKAFYPCYGMAESTLIITGGDKSAAPIVKNFDSKALEEDRAIENDNIKKTVSLVGSGRNLPGQNLAIVNPQNLKLCVEGEIGEIWTKSDSVASGYWQQEKLTAASFQAQIADTNLGGFLRTGDLGFLQNGELFVTGRLKDLIIIRGRNYYPQDIELAVDNAHEAVRSGNSAAFAVEEAGSEKLVVTAEVKRTYLRKLDSTAVSQAIRQAIASHHELQVAEVVLLKTGSIPKTSSGKIKRHACKQGFLAGNLNVVGKWKPAEQPVKISKPIADTQVQNHQGREKIVNWLRDNLAHTLEISPTAIDLNEPLANFGLSSIQAVRLSADLEDWLQVDLAPTVVYDYPTIAQLAEYLSKSTETNSDPQTQVSDTLPALNAPIAIIGMDCRFPGANNVEEFWQLLRDGKDAISKSDRWTGDSWGGFIRDVDKFEPQFFGITPRETQRMDPQQRLLLEVCWSALENAAIAPDSLAGSNTGVFVGLSSSDYSQLQFHYGTASDAYSGTGNAHSIAANRISYTLDLRGPSLAVDTACSSSLVALHLASQSLRNGECDRAIVGGVNLMLAPELTETFTLAGMMAADGRCKTFDAAADGYVRGEGCGVVVLKRLSEAIADKDRILAVIKGSATEQDGRSNGLTAPNGLAQQRVIRRAIANARIAPEDISYIEAHGTGTSLGDPIEVNSLIKVLNHDPEKQNTCYLGSVKTNIGHLEAAAGVAGLIKTVLCLQHQTIPPNLHFEQLNPHIDLKNTAIAISTQLHPWHTDKTRLAGVSSFGFGGTNAHIILEDYEVKAKQQSELPERPLHLLSLSAKSATALEELIVRYEQYLATHSDLTLANLCYTANTGRSHFDYRLAIAAASIAELKQKLTDYKGNSVTAADDSKHSSIVFLFTGQGSQYSGMGYELYQTQPVFRQAIDRCGEILRPYLDKPLQEIIYPNAVRAIRKLPLEKIDINETQYTQPAIFALEYALAQMWLSWGIVPDAVMGHSIGEYVAAVIAGVFSLSDGLKLIAARGRLMQTQTPQGAMFAVLATEAVVSQAIATFSGTVAIAAINGDRNVVISGKRADVAKVVEDLTAQGIKCKQLNVSGAFHSPLMKSILEDFAAVAGEVNYAVPQLKLISNVTGKIATSAIATPKYWVDHIVAPVRFAQSIQLLRQDYSVFLEIGAKPILSGMGRLASANDRDNNVLWLPSLRPKQADWQQILQTLATLYTRGYAIDWRGFDRPYVREKLGLPTYPFQRQSYWLERTPQHKTRERLRINIEKNESKSSTPDFYQIEWRLRDNLTNSDREPNLADLWLIFSDRQGVGAKIAAKLTASGKTYRTVTRQDANQIGEILADCDDIGGILYLWGLDGDDLGYSELNQQWQSSCSGLLDLIRELTRQGIIAPIWVGTQETWAIDNEVGVNAITNSSLVGIAGAIAIEHPEYWGGIVDLPAIVTEAEVNNLLSIIATQEREDRLALRSDRVYVSRLVKSQMPVVNKLEISSDSAYLITGGMGALGLHIARWLVDKGAKYIILASRSQASATAKEIINELTAKGAVVRQVRADVTQQTDIEKLVKLDWKLSNASPQLKGIIHAAGMLDDGILVNQTSAKFEKVIAPKVIGAWHLHQATKNLPLDFFVMCSSVASLVGSPGQSNYAAANAGLDAIARYRQSQNLPALSINWGPWADTGMAVARGFSQSGLDPIKPSGGLAALERAIGSNLAQVGVITADWQQLSQHLSYLHQSNYFAELIEITNTERDAKPRERVYAELLAMPAAERKTYLLDYLQQAIAEILQVEPRGLDLTVSLLDLGMDSLMIMEAISRLKADLKLMLYPREVYEHPKIESLATYLAAEFSQTHGTKVRATTPKTTSTQSPLTTPIAFILSSPRSGSTLLRVMLAGHPQLISPPELHLLPFATMQERERELGVSQLGEGLTRALMALKNLDAAAAKKLVDDLIADNLSIREIYQMLQGLSGDRLLIDKSPTYANQRETLDNAERMFGNAKYIHLVRHPYAVIESFARMRMDKLIGSKNSDPYLLAETIWQESNQNIVDFCSELDPQRHYLVRYEELVSQPQEVMEGVCNFLQVPFDPAVLTPYRGDRLTDGVHSNSLSLGDPNFGNRQQIEAKLASAWQEIELPSPLGTYARQIARQLNYELPHQTDLNEELPMQEILLNIRGLRICLCMWGPEEGPIVLCLHGILEQGAAWSEVAIRLAQKGYRVIAPDLRGHGRSDRVGKGGSYNLVDFLGDIDAIVENLAGKAFTLVGHSLGSVVAAIFAAIRPQRIEHIVLVETILPTTSEEEDAVEQLSTQLDYLASPPEHPVFTDVEAAAERLRQATPALSKPLAKLLAERITEPCEGGVRWRWEPLLRTRAGIGFNGIGRSRYLKLLKKIKIPITLVYGDKSNFNRSEDLSAQQNAMPTAEKVVLSGGHNLPLETPSALAKIISGAVAFTNKLIP